MLGKLIKYDIRSTWRDFAGIYLAILLGVIFLPILFTYVDNAVINIVAGLVITGIVIATIVFMIAMLFKIFNANIFSKEGYLTMTLPVAGAEIVASKLIVSTMWIVLTGIVSSIGICVFIWSIAPVAEIFPAVRKVLSMLNDREFLAIALSILAIIAAIVKEIAKLFLACSISHLKQLGRFRMLIGIISFFVMSWLETLLVKIVGRIVELIPWFTEYFNQIETQVIILRNPLQLRELIGLYNGAMAVGILYALALTVVFAAGVVWILNRKLDLD